MSLKAKWWTLGIIGAAITAACYAASIAAGVIMTILCLAVALRALNYYGKRDNLRGQSTGATRIETVRQQDTARTLAQYESAGWALVEQTSAKSFGSQARVTMTFRKG